MNLILRLSIKLRKEKVICRVLIRLEIVRASSTKLSIKSKKNICQLSSQQSRRNFMRRSMLSSKNYWPSRKKSRVKGLSRNKLIVS